MVIDKSAIDAAAALPIIIASGVAMYCNCTCRCRCEPTTVTTAKAIATTAKVIIANYATTAEATTAEAIAADSKKLLDVGCGTDSCGDNNCGTDNNSCRIDRTCLSGVWYATSDGAIKAMSTIDSNTVNVSATIWWRELRQQRR